MLHALFKVRLGNLRTELKIRNQWPLVEPRPLNPHTWEVWRQFLASGEPFALLDRESLPVDPKEITPYLRHELSLPADLDVQAGCARSYLLWLIRRRPPDGNAVVPCLPMAYLCCEEAIARLETVLAWLNDGN